MNAIVGKTPSSFPANPVQVITNNHPVIIRNFLRGVRSNEIEEKLPVGEDRITIIY